MSALRMRQRVVVRWDEDNAYAGRICELQYEHPAGGRRPPFLAQVRVAYEVDAQELWHPIDQVQLLPEGALVELPSIDDEEEVVIVPATQTSLWQKFSARCVYSHELLTDPARFSACTHPSCVQYFHLESCLRATRTCPVAGCNVKNARSRDLERDDELREALATLPQGTEECWLRGTSDLRLDKPTAGSPSGGWSSTSTGGVRPPRAGTADRAADRADRLTCGRCGRVCLSGTGLAAHTRGCTGLPPAEDDSDAEEEVAEEEAEGMRLALSSRSGSGYVGVAMSQSGPRTRYRAYHVPRQGYQKFLGYFDTAKAAAVARARYMLTIAESDEEVEVDAELEDDKEEEAVGSQHEGRAGDVAGGCVGSVVWAKMRGWPMWPAIVAPAGEGAGISRRGRCATLVRFYGTGEVGWIATADLANFDELTAEVCAGSVRASLRSSFWQAVAEARSAMGGAEGVGGVHAIGNELAHVQVNAPNGHAIGLCDHQLRPSSPLSSAASVSHAPAAVRVDAVHMLPSEVELHAREASLDARQAALDRRQAKLDEQAITLHRLYRSRADALVERGSALGKREAESARQHARREQALDEREAALPQREVRPRLALGLRVNAKYGVSRWGAKRTTVRV